MAVLNLLERDGPVKLGVKGHADLAQATLGMAPHVPEPIEPRSAGYLAGLESGRSDGSTCLL